MILAPRHKPPRPLLLLDLAHLVPILILVLLMPLSAPITPNRARLRARKRDRLAALLVIAERAEGLERLRRVQSHPAVICVNITTYITVLIGVRGARCEGRSEDSNVLTSRPIRRWRTPARRP